MKLGKLFLECSKLFDNIQVALHCIQYLLTLIQDRELKTKVGGEPGTQSTIESDNVFTTLCLKSKELVDILVRKRQGALWCLLLVYWPR